MCVNGQKAGGVTGSPKPAGDAFDIDYVAHEMGHQFGGNHPFNGTGGNCGGGNRNPSTAWEPGSGSTIMAYAGICGAANDLQANTDPTFHTGNYEEIRAFIDGATCGTAQSTGNTAPAVVAPAGGKTLPIGTPFKLTATATDAENDALTYSWEELDLGSAGPPTAPQVPGDNVPLFRSFNPVASGTRFFPRLSSLVANTSGFGERLPTVTRQLKFRCTARDEHSGPAGVIGGVNFSSLVELGVTSTAGPFVVKAPNTAVTWTGGAAQTISWEVANTTAAPVSCALVNLRLSLDGGLTYPVLLAQNEANDGSAVVVAPSPATAQTQARVLVEAVDNYFFDISNANFTITPPATGPTITSFAPTGGLPGTVVTVLGSNFTGVTAVSFNGTAAAGFTVNSATQLTATVAAGTTTGPLTVTAPTGRATSATSFVVGAPPVVSAFAATTGPVGATIVVTGTAFTGATQVTFGGTVAPTFTVNSDTQITATAPAGVTSGPLAVTAPGGVGSSAAAFLVPAANDLCVNALPLACGQTVTGTTLGATAASDPTGSCVETIDQGGVFYRIVGTGASITVSTCSAATAFDTKLFVYSGTCGSYVCVDGNDDAANCAANSMASTLTFAAAAGTEYLVFVSGYDTEAGSFTLSATCAPLTPTATTAATRSEFSVWPNPVAGKGALHVALAAPAKATLTLWNVLGQLVSTRTFSGSSAELATQGLAAGTYLLTVQVEGRSPGIRRVVVE
ncbi:MAG: hypothetical protein NVS3B25_10650 [Hymenobacter sp.]